MVLFTDSTVGRLLMDVGASPESRVPPGHKSRGRRIDGSRCEVDHTDSPRSAEHDS